MPRRREARWDPLMASWKGLACPFPTMEQVGHISSLGGATPGALAFIRRVPSIIW
jgi:hypothetical protein